MFVKPPHRRVRLATRLALIVAGAILLAFPAVATAGPPLAFPLSIDGTAMLDANGVQVDLRGFQIVGMVKGSGNERTACGYGWKEPKKSWARTIAQSGFNTVRLGIAWAHLEYEPPTLNEDGTLTHHWNWTYVDALDRTIAHFASYGLAVVLDMHNSQWSPAFRHYRPNNANRFICEGAGMPAWLYPNTPPGVAPAPAKCEFYKNVQREGVPIGPLDGYIEAWKFVAFRYLNAPNVVGGDLMAEPGWAVGACDASNNVVDEMFFSVGSAVRTVNPNLFLIYQNGTWANFMKRGPLLSHRLELPNAVYSWHWYPPDWDATVLSGVNPGTGKDFLMRNFAISQEYGQPFWLGEFNAFNEGYAEPRKKTDPNWQADLAEAMAYMKENHIGWSFFAFNTGSGSSLLAKETKEPKPELLAGLQAGL